MKNLSELLLAVGLLLVLFLKLDPSIGSCRRQPRCSCSPVRLGPFALFRRHLPGKAGTTGELHLYRANRTGYLWGWFPFRSSSSSRISATSSILSAHHPRAHDRGEAHSPPPRPHQVLNRAGPPAVGIRDDVIFSLLFVKFTLLFRSSRYIQRSHDMRRCLRRFS
jgi:hypothetical protein